MGPGDALDALLCEQLVEQAAGAAIAIEDEDRFVLALGLADLVADARAR